MTRHHATAASLHYLQRAAASLTEATASVAPADRYALAHVAALQATAAILADRPSPPPRRGPARRNAWCLLVRAAPEFAPWADLFAAGAAKRDAARAGSQRSVSETEAVALLGDVDRFLALVEAELGVIPHRRPVELC